MTGLRTVVYENCATGEIKQGKFHQWSIDTGICDEAIITYPVAIVELSNGTVELVHAEKIRFVEEKE